MANEQAWRAVEDEYEKRLPEDMQGFGLASIKEEGAPQDPRELIYSCSCGKCLEHYRRQWDAFTRYQNSRRLNEHQGHS